MTMPRADPAIISATVSCRILYTPVGHHGHLFAADTCEQRRRHPAAASAQLLQRGKIGNPQAALLVDVDDVAATQFTHRVVDAHP